MKLSKFLRIKWSILLVIFLVVALAINFGPIVKTKNHEENKKPTLANPASVYCSEKGGTNVIFTLGNGSQDGLCQFEDNMACEEWAMYRGECPIGGVKTTGYDNRGQMYCAWLGGKTLAVPNSECTLPNGNVCSTEALIQGGCN